jgi:class 3 adenylate cyclase/tetratricopeptide (TPR) repeat protein
MKCPKCQFDNPEGFKFCGKCGHNLVLPSKEFHKGVPFEEKLKNIQRYLPDGLAEKILSQRDRIEGEHKQVTVMFCDMEGFTPLTEELGSEKVYNILDQVFEILIQKVHDYDGTVNEMTGDGIMALFGAPIALEDSPQRAIRSALAIHREIAKFNDRLKHDREGIPSLKMRIGIHTGPVVVGTIGNDLRVEFTAVGDTVNLASRMEGLAEPGATYVTDDTYKLTRDLFHFKALGEKEVKGKKQPVAVYKLLSDIQDVYRPRLGSERMIYSEMVGRDGEIDRLELQVMKLINGQGSVVNIIGEAGIGKSRLVAELKKREVMNRVTLFEGRAISMGRNLSFHPIIDMLKQWAQIKIGDGEAASFGKLETAVRGLFPEEVGEVLPFVATLMGMKLSGRYAERIKGIEGEALEKLILKTMRDILIKASETTPLVIVAEDLHWADSSTIELMESLIHLVENQRLLFINVFRSGYRQTSDRIVQTIKEKLQVYNVGIVLQPLDDRMSEALINNMLKVRSLPHGVRDQILKRACGNPFYIEEVVRSLIDEKVVMIKNGEFEVTDKIESVVIPRTISDVLMARIDRLEEKTRNLVKVASVIGRNFFYRVLTEVAKAIEDIDSRLSYLKEIQLIKEQVRMEEIEYLFKHVLAQEAAYESILHEKRKELHLKVADAIEKVFREKLPEFYGMLAYHYSRGDNLEKAEEYLIKAGAEALRSSASAEALNYYQQGLKLYLKKYGKAADPEKLASFEKNIALAFFHKGQYENAVSYFDSVLERWGIDIPKKPIVLRCRIVCDLLSVIANLYLPFGKSKKIPSQRDNEIFDLSYKKAITLVHLDPQECFSEFINTFKRINKFDITKIENGFGMWISASGLFSWTGISFRLSKKILDYAKTIINKNEIRQIFFCNLFELLYDCFTGNWPGVKEYDDDLVALNLRVGEYWHVSTYIVFYGYLAIERGAFSEAEAIIDKLSEIWETYGNENGIEYWYSLKIVLLILLRKFHDALKEADTGIAFQRQTGRELVVIYYIGYKAVIQIQLEDISGAKESLLQAKKLVSKIGFVPPIYISGYLKAQFLFDLHLLEQAIRSNDKKEKSEYIQAAKKSGKRALKNSAKYALDRTEILRMMGLYWWFIGGQTRAIRFWNHSIKVAERFGANVQLAKTYMEIGQRLSEKTSRFRKLNSISAEEYLEKAKSLFEKFGLESEFEKLDKLKTSR